MHGENCYSPQQLVNINYFNRVLRAKRVQPSIQDRSKLHKTSHFKTWLGQESCLFLCLADSNNTLEKVLVVRVLVRKTLQNGWENITCSRTIVKRGDTEICLSINEITPTYIIKCNDKFCLYKL